MHLMTLAGLNKTRATGLALATAAALTLVGCGGSDSTTAAGVSVVTGQFVDATVVGLGYKCGTSTALSGTTNASGQFTCASGEAVAFYVGGIKLGSVSAAQAVVTPLDLVGAGATPSDPTVNNIVRFLMSISSTPAANGTITIDPAVVTAAAGKTVDFTKVLGADLDVVINAVKPAGAILATPADATTHMSDSMFGLFAGSFSGSFSGSFGGTWSITIDSKGGVTGTATDSSGGVGQVSGTMATTMGTGSTYAFSGTGGGTPWMGVLNVNTKQFSGTWDDGAGSKGTFTGTETATAKPAAGTPSGTTGANTLIVSGVTPTTGNGNFSLPLAVETAAGGSSTAKRVEFTDATPATRTLRLYYQPQTGVLENVQYESPEKSFNCFVGDPMMACDSAKITFSASGKSILLDLAAFKSGTTVNGVLEGLLTW